MGEEKHVRRIGLGIDKVHFAEEVKRLSSHLVRVRGEAVGDLKAVLIGLMFLLAAEGAADGIGDKEENREQQKQGGQ